MMSLNGYWKEKAAKRRKSWASKAKRYADKHMQLEDIRKEVYLPLDYAAGFDFEDYKQIHFTKRNPIIEWQEMNLWFVEDGLRVALEAEGADMSSFKMEVNRLALKGKEAPQPKNRWEAYSYLPNKVFDYEKLYLDWLKRMYEICTDVETVHLSYGQITMTIKRYSTDGMPFGYYELNPCEQLTKSAMLLQETDFYTLNVATMLMEAAAEWELRQEEFNYYAKQLKIRTMEAATTDSIVFELWDDKKIQKKLKEYAVKEYSLDQVLGQVLSPWKKAVGDYLKAVTERDFKDNSLVLNARNCFYNLDFAQRFVNEKLRPYLDNHGLKETKAFIPANSYKQVVIEYKGYRVLIKRDMWTERFVLYPYAFDDKFLESDNNRLHLEMPKLTLNAIAEYLKQMPAINERIDKVIEKIENTYRELKNNKTQ
ncbi:MAG: hypothetical protein K6E52_10030 [Bacteroidaceae bacterium]|nr:hypothetical protein [Bacteroidaceae bacterium]